MYWRLGVEELSVVMNESQMGVAADNNGNEIVSLGGTASNWYLKSYMPCCSTYRLMLSS